MFMIKIHNKKEERNSIFTKTVGNIVRIDDNVKIKITAIVEILVLFWIFFIFFFPLFFIDVHYRD